MVRVSARAVSLVLLVVLGLGVANRAAAMDHYAASHPPSAAAMGADAVVVRPLSFAATIVGSGLFVVSLPFSLLGMNVGQAADRLVVEPAKYTFARPLGHFRADRPRH